MSDEHDHPPFNPEDPEPIPPAGAFEHGLTQSQQQAAAQIYHLMGEFFTSGLVVLEFDLPPVPEGQFKGKERRGTKVMFQGGYVNAIGLAHYAAFWITRYNG